MNPFGSRGYKKALKVEHFTLQIILLLLITCVVYRTCAVDAFRCKGVDSGCCTKDTPCEKGDGDCDSDSDCAGGLTCGTNNCQRKKPAPWDSTDDCCEGEKCEFSFSLISSYILFP